MTYGNSIVTDMIQSCSRIQIVSDALSLLEDGFPLDAESKTALNSIGIDYVEFTKRYEIKDD